MTFCLSCHCNVWIKGQICLLLYNIEKKINYCVGSPFGSNIQSVSWSKTIWEPLAYVKVAVWHTGSLLYSLSIMLFFAFVHSALQCTANANGSTKVFPPSNTPVAPTDTVNAKSLDMTLHIKLSLNMPVLACEKRYEIIII